MDVPRFMSPVLSDLLYSPGEVGVFKELADALTTDNRPFTGV